MKKVFLGLGTNLGNRSENLRRALLSIEKQIGAVVSSSSVYETEPWGFRSDEHFLNMVLCVETDLSPAGLLQKILTIEELLGRKRGELQYVSRVIDIDILLYDDQVIEEKDLRIPHPLIHERRFVLEPLCEIEPEMIHPVSGKSFKDILKECKDNTKVQNLGPPTYAKATDGKTRPHYRTTERPHDF